MRPLARSALIVGAVVASAFSSDRASAQSIPSPYRFIETVHEIGLFGGYVQPDTGPFEFGPGEGPLIGARYAIELSGPFSLEAVSAVQLSERNVVDPRRSEGDRIIGQTDAIMTSIDGRLKFALNGRRTWYGFGPFLTAGGGIVFDAVGRGDLDRELEEEDRYNFSPSFLGIVGGGVRYSVSERIMLRADVDGRLWKITTPQGFSDPALRLGPVERDQWVAGLGWTLGAAIRF